MLCEEATNTNFIVFGLTRPVLEPTIYRTRDEQANRYAIDVVLDDLVLFNKIVDMKYNVHDPFLE